MNQRISHEDTKAQDNCDKKVNFASIGVFDSGIGGLTLVRALKQSMPSERIVYLGDSARVPYGSKSSATIQIYAAQAIKFLRSTHVKYIVVACNSASANLPELLDDTVPIVGVIDITAQAAVRRTRSKRIGILGTLATIRSKAYINAVHQLDSRIQCDQLACPLFVPLAEEGWTKKDVTRDIIREYLGELAIRSPDIDQLILGCTHYPLLKDRIADEVAHLFPKAVALVDSALESAKGVELDLISKDLRCPDREDTLADKGVGDRFFFTDASRFEELAQRFLGYVPDQVEYIDL